jgi:hypothetical protein
LPLSPEVELEEIDQALDELYAPVIERLRVPTGFEGLELEAARRLTRAERIHALCQKWRFPSQVEAIAEEMASENRRLRLQLARLPRRHDMAFGMP